jgi:hypothetical protein
MISYVFVRKSSSLFDLRHQNSRVMYQCEQLLLLPWHVSSDNGNTFSTLLEQLPSIGHLFYLASREATLKSHGSRNWGVSPVLSATEEQSRKLFQDIDLAGDPGVTGVQCVPSALDATVYGFHGAHSISSGGKVGEVRAVFPIVDHRAVVPSLALLSLLLRSKLPSVYPWFFYAVLLVEPVGCRIGKNVGILLTFEGSSVSLLCGFYV